MLLRMSRCTSASAAICAVWVMQMTCRPAAVCRELTKTYEEVRRGPLAELLEWASGKVLGEITVVIGGAPSRAASLPDAVGAVLQRVAGGVRFKEAVASVASETGVSRGVLYDAALAARREEA